MVVELKAAERGYLAPLFATHKRIPESGLLLDRDTTE
jgi:hypothetical protein